jgi:NADP-dependent 3-hydroxy acid dehydrogenase YdfG
MYWQWVLVVNLWGVIHGVHYFVPRMLEQDAEGHIVNTASIGGLQDTGAWPRSERYTGRIALQLDCSA